MSLKFYVHIKIIISSQVFWEKQKHFCLNQTFTHFSGNGKEDIVPDIKLRDLQFFYILKSYLTILCDEDLLLNPFDSHSIVVRVHDNKNDVSTSIPCKNPLNMLHSFWNPKNWCVYNQHHGINICKTFRQHSVVQYYNTEWS